MNLQILLDKFNIKADISILLEMWNESHRSFHNLDHLNDIISQINESYGNKQINELQKEKLLLTALFHDIIYDPSKQDNEEKSADFLMSLCQEKNDKDIIDIKNAILDTKTHKSSTPLSLIFNRFDMSIVERNYDDLLNWENGIYNEYKIYGNDNYKNGRVKFLESLLDSYPNNTDNLMKLINFVKNNY